MMRRQFRTMGAALRLGRARSSPAIPSTTAGTSGSSCSSWRRASPTAQCRRWTGAPTTGRSRASRSRAPTATAGAAARRSRSATWTSGTCGSPTYADELLDFSGIDWPDPIRIMQTNWIGRSRARRSSSTTAPDDAPRRRRGAARLHDAAGHAVRRDVHGAGARAPAGRPSSPPPSAGPRSRRTSRRRPRTRPRSTACPPTARRPACRSAPTRSTRSTASGSRSGSPTTCWPRYGTGAIMAVPAHDERDFAFADQVRAADPRGSSRRAGLDERPDAAMAEALRRHARRASVLVNSAASTACRPTEGGTAIVARAGGARARPSRRSPTACATG